MQRMQKNLLILLKEFLVKILTYREKMFIHRHLGLRQRGMGRCDEGYGAGRQGGDDFGPRRLHLRPRRPRRRKDRLYAPPPRIEQRRGGTLCQEIPRFAVLRGQETVGGQGRHRHAVRHAERARRRGCPQTAGQWREGRGRSFEHGLPPRGDRRFHRSQDSLWPGQGRECRRRRHVGSGNDAERTETQLDGRGGRCQVAPDHVVHPSRMPRIRHREGRLHQLYEGRQYRRLHEGCQVDGRTGCPVKTDRNTQRSGLPERGARFLFGDGILKPGTPS